MLFCQIDIVSKKTTQGGRKSYVVVALYVKKGNVEGEFSKNVEKGQYTGPVGEHSTK